MINYYNELPGLQPVETKRKCTSCNQYLGSANPGDLCSTCKWVFSGDQQKRKFF